MVVYNLAVGVYKVSTSEDEETFVKFKSALTNAVAASVGLVVLGGAMFFPKTILSLMGVSEDQNVFAKGANCDDL